MEKLHKMVNGKKIELTDEEEAQVRAEWEENRKAQEVEKQKGLDKENRCLQLRQKLADVMAVTLEEVNLMLSHKVIGNDGG